MDSSYPQLIVQFLLCLVSSPYPQRIVKEERAEAPPARLRRPPTAPLVHSPFLLPSTRTASRSPRSS
eukprot:gene676-biopygen6710